jgi:tRNA G18 (ribose-2'-O)-methylase SpoU
VCALDWPRCGRLAPRATHRRIAHRRRRTGRRSDRVGDLPAARRRTVAVLGHEQSGIPADALDLIDLFVEIPMVGIGASLNVAVAGSLVLYRLAGLL